MRLVLFPGGMETSDEAKLMVLDEPSLRHVMMTVPPVANWMF